MTNFIKDVVQSKIPSFGILTFLEFSQDLSRLNSLISPMLATLLRTTLHKEKSGFVGLVLPKATLISNKKPRKLLLMMAGS